jgi:hypothetical protein
MHVYGNTDILPSSLGSIGGVAPIANKATRIPTTTMPADTRIRQSYDRAILADETTVAERNPLAMTFSIVSTVDHHESKSDAWIINASAKRSVTRVTALEQIISGSGEFRVRRHLCHRFVCER